MSLERDIQQRVFRNEYQKAVLNILHTQNFIVGAMADLFKHHGITRQQYNVLRILRGQYPESASVNLIKNRMLEKMSDTSRIVERLRIKGLIERAHGTVDRRSVDISITPAGLNLLKTMRDPVEKLERILDNLSPDEVRELNYLLDKIKAKNPADEVALPAPVESAELSLARPAD